MQNRCRRTYHLHCAIQANCNLDQNDKTLWCAAHAASAYISPRNPQRRKSTIETPPINVNSSLQIEQDNIGFEPDFHQSLHGVAENTLQAHRSNIYDEGSFFCAKNCSSLEVDSSKSRQVVQSVQRKNPLSNGPLELLQIALGKRKPTNVHLTTEEFRFAHNFCAARSRKSPIDNRVGIRACIYESIQAFRESTRRDRKVVNILRIKQLGSSFRSFNSSASNLSSSTTSRVFLRRNIKAARSKLSNMYASNLRKQSASSMSLLISALALDKSFDQLLTKRGEAKMGVPSTNKSALSKKRSRSSTQHDVRNKRNFSVGHNSSKFGSFF